MKKLLLTSVVLIQCFIGQTQEKLSYTSNQTLNDKVYELSQAEKFDSVLKELEKINPNDSIYDSKLVSKSFYLMKLNKHSEALKVLNEGLETGNIENRKSFYINKYICLQNLEDNESALKTLNKAIEEFPMNANLTLRKGTFYEGQKDYDNAMKYYEEALKKAPFDENVHLKIGNLFLTQHLTSQALMCFDMYLLLNPDGDSSFSVLNSLNNILSKDNDLKKIKGLKLSKGEADFEELDLILDSRISLSKKYKISNEINIAYAKQNHVLFQKLEELEEGKGLWSERYIPFYKWVFENNHFDNFIYTTAYSIENKKYKKVVDKNIKKIEAFLPLAYDKWEEIMRENIWTIDGKNVTLSANFLDRKVEGIGEATDGKFNGIWRFYKSSGRLNSVGRFNEEEKRVGEWKWYYDNGNVQELANYENGLLEGQYVGYYKNKTVNYQANYVAGKLEGPYQYYNNRGAMTQNKNFKEGVLNGRYESFHKAGESSKKYDLNFSKGEQDGVFTEKSIEGVEIFHVNKTNGKKQGIETNRYASGTLSSTFCYVNGDAQGEAKIYYKNGKIKSEGLAAEGSNTGEWKSYFSNGKLHEKYTYKKGEYDGAYFEYAPDGKIYNEFIYRKGELIGYKFYDKTGEIIKEAKKKGGEFFYEGHSINGSIKTEGLYDVKGGKEGVWKFYSGNGILETIGNYKEGNLSGENTNYHGNGKVRSKELYVNDTLQGYVEKYFEDGQMKSQGYAVAGAYDKEWRTYYKNGGLNAVNFYHKGDYHGTQKYYSVEGKLIQVLKYEFGDLLLEENYGKNENILCSIDYQNLKRVQKVKLLHENGKTNKDFSFLNGALHGAYKAYDYYGNILTKGNYLNGEPTGTWEWFFDNGEKLSEYTLVNGVRHGVYKRYYKTGALEEWIEYNLGDRVTYTNYAEDGKTIVAKSTYLEEGLDGKRYSYSNEGKLQLIRIYELGRLIGYSYLDKKGAEIPMIPIVNETAKIVAYFDNGKKSRELEYVNGNLENDYLQYFYSGKLHHKKYFKLNNFYGKAIEYFSNGNVKTETDYHNDDFHGKRKSFYANGKLKEEITYKNDQRSGKATYYNEKGKLLKTEFYFNGNVYDVEE